ncbi:MAG: hypothetical protein ACOCNI_07235 [Prevotella pectinovora]
MASYNGNIDYLAPNGVKVLKGIDNDNPERVYICTPLDVNEIKLERHPRDPNRMVAKMRVNIWPLSENYKNVVRRSAQERGDTNVSVPTHEMQMSFSAGYIKAAVQKFPKLVEQVKEANKERDPDIVNQDPTDENTHLFKAIRQRMNKRLAMLYQPQSTQQPSPYATPNVGVAGAVTGYVAPAEGTDPLAGFTDADVGDLPF